jgi:hypothetical protein
VNQSSVLLCCDATCGFSRFRRRWLSAARPVLDLDSPGPLVAWHDLNVNPFFGIATFGIANWNVSQRWIGIRSYTV